MKAGAEQSVHDQDVRYFKIGFLKSVSDPALDLVRQFLEHRQSVSLQFFLGGDAVQEHVVFTEVCHQLCHDERIAGVVAFPGENDDIAREDVEFHQF